MIKVQTSNVQPKSMAFGSFRVDMNCPQVHNQSLGRNLGTYSTSHLDLDAFETETVNTLTGERISICRSPEDNYDRYVTTHNYNTSKSQIYFPKPDMLQNGYHYLAHSGYEGTLDYGTYTTEDSSLVAQAECPNAKHPYDWSNRMLQGLDECAFNNMRQQGEWIQPDTWRRYMDAIDPSDAPPQPYKRPPVPRPPTPEPEPLYDNVLGLSQYFDSPDYYESTDALHTGPEFVTETCEPGQFYQDYMPFFYGSQPMTGEMLPIPTAPIRYMSKDFLEAAKDFTPFDYDIVRQVLPDLVPHELLPSYAIQPQDFNKLYSRWNGEGDKRNRAFATEKMKEKDKKEKAKKEKEKKENKKEENKKEENEKEENKKEKDMTYGRCGAQKPEERKNEHKRKHSETSSDDGHTCQEGKKAVERREIKNNKSEDVSPREEIHTSVVDNTEGHEGNKIVENTEKLTDEADGHERDAKRICIEKKRANRGPTPTKEDGVDYRFPLKEFKGEDITKRIPKDQNHTQNTSSIQKAATRRTKLSPKEMKSSKISLIPKASIRKTKKSVNAFIAYRMFYQAYVDTEHQMITSGIVKSLWHREPEVNKGAWARVARLYSDKRNQETCTQHDLRQHLLRLVTDAGLAPNQYAARMNGLIS